jgi:hypothetical protein
MIPWLILQYSSLVICTKLFPIAIFSILKSCPGCVISRWLPSRLSRTPGGIERNYWQNTWRRRR